LDVGNILQKIVDVTSQNKICLNLIISA